MLRCELLSLLVKHAEGGRHVVMALVSRVYSGRNRSRWLRKLLERSLR